MSVNSVTPSSTIVNGTTNPVINWQATEGGTYTIKIGGTNCTNGTLATGMTLNWTKATDDVTAQGSLQYKVVRSLSNNISSVATAESNGTVVQDWATDIATVNVTGLNEGTTYWFNIIVKDSVGNNSSYTMKYEITTICYDGGCFEDKKNGTVAFTGNAGTFGGNSYTAQTLTFMKCSQGQTWNSGTNSCDGTAGTYQYCNENDNDCNGGTDTGTLGTFSGNGSSSAYTSCNTLSFAGKGAGSWRVPTKNELKTLIHCTNKTMPNDYPTSPYYCDAGYTSPNVNNLFPNTIASDYWSSSTQIASSNSAWSVGFYNGDVYNGNKNFNSYVRCVSGL